MDDYPPDYEGMNDKPFTPEDVREPASNYEWFDALCTEFIWQSGRTLPLSQFSGLNMVIASLFHRGATPIDAAQYLIQQLGLAV